MHIPKFRLADLQNADLLLAIETMAGTLVLFSIIATLVLWFLGFGMPDILVKAFIGGVALMALYIMLLLIEAVILIIRWLLKRFVS